MYIEALCTCRGVLQSFLAGSSVFGYVARRWPESGIALYSSALPRAMQTAQDMSIQLPRGKRYIPEIRRLPFITERFSDEELEHDRIHPHYGTANTTSIVASNAHARALNRRRLGGATPISACERDNELLALCAATPRNHGTARIYFTAGDYGRFLDAVVPNLDSVCQAVHCIVGHGWYIRDLVIASCARSDDPDEAAETAPLDILDNLEAAVVEYTLDEENVVRKSVLIGRVAEPLKDGDAGNVPRDAPPSLRHFLTRASSTCKCEYDDRAIVDDHADARDCEVRGARPAPT
jgi:hypothetical protein